MTNPTIVAGAMHNVRLEHVTVVTAGDESIAWLRIGPNVYGFNIFPDDGNGTNRARVGLAELAEIGKEIARQADIARQALTR